MLELIAKIFCAVGVAKTSEALGNAQFCVLPLPQRSLSNGVPFSVHSIAYYIFASKRERKKSLKSQCKGEQQ